MSFKCLVIVLFCVLYTWSHGYSPDVSYTPSFRHTPHRNQRIQLPNYHNSPEPFPYLRAPIVQRVVLKPMVSRSFYGNQPYIEDQQFNPNQRFQLGPVVNQNNLRVIQDVIDTVEAVNSYNPESSRKLKKERQIPEAFESKDEDEDSVEIESDEVYDNKYLRKRHEMPNREMSADNKRDKSGEAEVKKYKPDHNTPQSSNQWHKIKISPVKYEVNEEFAEIDNRKEKQNSKGNRKAQQFYPESDQQSFVNKHGSHHESEWHAKKGDTGENEHTSDHHQAQSKKKKDDSGHEHKEESEEHHKAKKGQKGGKAGEKKHHKKGNKASGYHNVFHKDEFKEDKTFYDTADHKGSHHKYGSEHGDHHKKAGHKEKGEKHESGHEEKHKEKKGHSEKGHSDKGDAGYDKKEGHDKHHKGEEHHHKDEKSHKGEEKGFKKEHKGGK